MKRNIRSAVRHGISESDLNGYKWELTIGGIKWEYCDVEFIFRLHEFDEGEQMLTVHQKDGGTVYEESWITVLIGDSKYCDAQNVEDAYRIATKATIKKANRLF